jgi:hypothetical protein
VVGRFRSRLNVLIALVVVLFPAAAAGQVKVVTERYDNSRTGANLSETVLNTSNVNVTQFGKLFSYIVDGSIYAQPLYVPNVPVAGQGTHNVLYVVTMNDVLYAFDADSNSLNGGLLWSVDFRNPAAGVTPIPIMDIVGRNDGNIVGNVGIESTPVIDLSSNTLYLVARTKEVSGSTTNYVARLHAIDITSGNEKFGGPVVINASVPLAFDTLHQNQRSSLALVNGMVLFSWASHEDLNVWYGWIMAYNAQTLQQLSAFCTTPGDSEGGVWMSGRAPVIDGNGNVYYATGNGGWDGVSNFGDSVLKFSTTGGILSLTDYFTPDDYAMLASDDLDLGSSGPLLIPGTNLLVHGGKESVFYVMNLSNLGHEQAGNGQIVQSFPTIGSEIHGGPVFWNRTSDAGPTMYVWPNNVSLQAYQFNGSNFNTNPISQSTIVAPRGDSGGVLTLSSNGSTAGTGIVWSSIPLNRDADIGTVEGVLRAFDANNLTTELWDSAMNLARDDIGLWPKYSPPTVVNGKVYMASFSNLLNVYGLLPPDFSLSVKPAAQLVTPGGNTTYTVSTLAQLGFSGTVDLSVSGLPVGVTASFSSSSITTPGSAILTVTTAATTPIGSATLTITGTSGSLTHGVTATLTVGTAGTVIPQSGWSLLSVDSQETICGNYGAVHSFDGNPATFWHTQWCPSVASLPHNIQVNLGASYNISGFTYLPRQDGCSHGWISQYQFYVSTDGVNWGNPVASGTFNYGTATTGCQGASAPPAIPVLFPSTNGQYIQLRALSEVNGNPYTSMAELNVLAITTSTATLSSLTLNPSSVVGGNTSQGTVTLSAAAPSSGAAVTLSSSNTSAATVPASVSIASGASSATFTVTTSSVSTSTSSTISASYAGVTDSALLSVATVSVLSSLTLNPSSLVGGNTSQGTVTLNAAAPSSGAVVTLSSSNTAAASVPGSVNIASGASSATFTVTTSSVSTSTSSTISASYAGETDMAALSVLTGSSGTALSSMTLNPSSVVGGSTSQGTVTLSAAAPSSGVVVTLSSSNTSAATVPTSVSIASGASGATFTVTTSSVSTSTSSTISASYAGVTDTAVLSVQTAGSSTVLSSLTLSPTSVVGGNTSQGTVTLSAAAPSSGVVVTLSSSNTSAATVPASVSIASGASSATFTVTTSSVSTSTSSTISASYAGVTDTAVLSVQTAGGGTVIPQSGWSLVSVDSQETSCGYNYGAVNSLDGNPATFWHTQWCPSVAPLPHNIQINLGASYNISGFTYLPRQDGCSNGWISQYQFYVSTDGVNWGSPVASGTFNYGTATTGCPGASAAPAIQVLCPTTTGRYVQLRALTEVSGNQLTSMAEVNVLASSTAPVPALTSLTLNPTTVVGGSLSQGTVTLSAAAPSSAIVVNLSSSNTAAATVPASVSIASGATSATFQITTPSVTSSTSSTISASYSGVTDTASLSVAPAAALTSLTLNPTTVVGGSPSQGTVTLSAAAPSSGIVVTLSSSNTAAATVPASVSIASGATSATFQITTPSVTSSTSSTISASYAGVTDTASLSIQKAGSGTIIPQSGWSLLSVDSQETICGNYGAVHSFDGNPATFWHTQWCPSVASLPHNIQVNLGASYSISGFTYLPRQDGCSHGWISQYQFYVSTDGVNWGSPVASGTFNYGTATTGCPGASAPPAIPVLFPSTNGQYIQLRALSEVNGNPYVSVAELNVLQ